MENINIVYEGERFLASIYTPREHGTCANYVSPDGYFCFVVVFP